MSSASEVGAQKINSCHLFQSEKFDSRLVCLFHTLILSYLYLSLSSTLAMGALVLLWTFSKGKRPRERSQIGSGGSNSSSHREVPLCSKPPQSYPHIHIVERCRGLLPISLCTISPFSSTALWWWAFYVEVRCVWWGRRGARAPYKH